MTNDETGISGNPRRHFLLAGITLLFLQMWLPVFTTLDPKERALDFVFSLSYHCHILEFTIQDSFTSFNFKASTFYLALSLKCSGFFFFFLILIEEQTQGE